MSKRELMTDADIHAFGLEILFKQLEKDGWTVESADALADPASEPQLVANKEGELAFFVVRTAVYPNRGRFDEGKEAFETLVQHAKQHGASCYYASIGIANGDATSEEEMSVPVKGAQFQIQFDGLVKMELPPSAVDAVGQ